MKTADNVEPLRFRPLYLQVKSNLVQRMVDGTWPPGANLPSEVLLASELGVSQGTVRKALDELAAENLLTRRQGRGTFVAEHDERRILFQFFKIGPDDGKPIFPESRMLGLEIASPDVKERSALALADNESVIRIRRLRALGPRPIILETLSLPEGLFPGLETGPIPNNLYSLFAVRYSVTIAHARERLKAVSLSTNEASLLGAKAGTPALLIDRIAFSLEGLPVEHRLSLCLTNDVHYQSDLR